MAPSVLAASLFPSKISSPDLLRVLPSANSAFPNAQKRIHGHLAHEKHPPRRFLQVHVCQLKKCRQLKNVARGWGVTRAARYPPPSWPPSLFRLGREREARERERERETRDYEPFALHNEQIHQAVVGVCEQGQGEIDQVGLQVTSPWSYTDWDMG
jgi:hypothetical protein